MNRNQSTCGNSNCNNCGGSCPQPQCGNNAPSCCPSMMTPPFTRPDCRYPPPPYEFCVSYSKFSGEMEEHPCIVTEKGWR